MSNDTSSIVSRVWSFCNPLRDVGVGYGDCLEHETQQRQWFKDKMDKNASWWFVPHIKGYFF